MMCCTGRPFWNADLGRLIGEKGQLYEAIDGLFIREFTNGWAVYNRSGKAQEIELPPESLWLGKRCRESTPAYVGRFGR